MRTTLLVLLLVVCLLAGLGHGRRRRRCRAGLRMGPSGCSRPGSATLGTFGWMREYGYDVLEDMKSTLENRLGREVLIPCTDGGGIHYCEVCYKDDPSRISCPTTVQQSSRTAECPEWPTIHNDNGERYDYSYWSGYDDGSICDCGSAFVIEFRDRYSNEPKLRGPMEGEDAFLGGDWAVSDVGMNTGRRDFPYLGDEYPTEPTIPASSSCRGHPDISSIFN